MRSLPEKPDESTNKIKPFNQMKVKDKSGSSFNLFYLFIFMDFTERL